MKKGDIFIIGFFCGVFAATALLVFMAGCLK